MLEVVVELDRVGVEVALKNFLVKLLRCLAIQHPGASNLLLAAELRVLSLVQLQAPKVPHPTKEHGPGDVEGGPVRGELREDVLCVAVVVGDVDGDASLLG